MAPPDPVIDIISRIKVLMMHLTAYHFPTDMEILMGFITEAMEWLQHQEEMQSLGAIPEIKSHKHLLNDAMDLKGSTSCSLITCPPEAQAIITECMNNVESEDYVMADELDKFNVYREGTEFLNPNFLYHYEDILMSNETLATFIRPLKTANYGIIIKLLLKHIFSKKIYDSRIRVLLVALSHYLAIEYTMFQAYETMQLASLEVEEKDIKSKKNKVTAAGIAAVGLAATGGAVVMTLTGGLAAPFVVSGLASIVGTSGTAFLATTTGLAIVASIFGAVGGGLTGYKVHKLVGSISEFKFQKISKDDSASVTIFVDGLLKSTKSPSTPGTWQGYTYTSEQYILRYESDALIKYTNALSDFIKDVAVAYVTDEVLKYTVIAALAASLTWPVTLLSLTAVIDNPWSVIMKKTRAVGKILAEVLVNRVPGKRPVNLVGYGQGARVIFYCLLELVTNYTPGQYSGIIEHVVMAGLPATAQPVVWEKISAPIAGKLVNCYSTNDWVLSFLYKTTRATRNVAGIAHVPQVNQKIVNINLEETIKGHTDYETKMLEVLKALGIANT